MCIPPTAQADPMIIHLVQTSVDSVSAIKITAQ